MSQGVKIVQYGEKSVYVEQNTGQITIHSPNGEVKIINSQDTEQLKQELGEKFNEIIALLRNLSSKPQIPHALTKPPFQSEIFLGRVEDLKNIKDKLFSGDNLLLLVNGQGGMGKTTIATKYYTTHANLYEHTAWVLSEKNIANALVTHLAAPLGIAFEPTDTLAQKREALLAAMANLGKPCLLVIDNANELKDLEDNYLLLRSCPNFHLLLTSRIRSEERRVGKECSS